MEKFNGRMASLCTGEHELQVYLCEEPEGNSYFLGVCLKCGLTIELPVRQIEEVFNGGD